MANSLTNRLVLLTHQFPYSFGDAAFISRQIEAFSGEFDEVAIFTYEDLTGVPLLSLPQNCVFYGAINPRQFKSFIRGVFFLAGWPIMLKQAFSLLKFRQMLREIQASIIGMSIATNPAIKKLAKEQKSGVQTVVYSFWGRGMGYGLPWLAPKFDATAVGLHGYDLYEERDGRIPLQSLVLSSADRVLPVSVHGRDYLLSKYPNLQSEKVLVSRLGVEGPIEIETKAIKDQIEIVSCSYLVEVKRIPLILHAVEELASRRGRVRWTHFGSGPLAEELKILAEQVSSLNNDLQICWKGHTENALISSYYLENNVSVFVNLSSSEGIPVSIMEAASCGIPSVATNVGGVAEIVGEQLGTGILIVADPSVKNVVDALERVIDAPSGHFNPHSFWKSNFDSRTNSKKLANDLLNLT